MFLFAAVILSFWEFDAEGRITLLLIPLFFNTL